mgnify:FL=1
MKKKDEKYENSLTEIRDLKNDVLTERNEREVKVLLPQKLQTEMNALMEKLNAMQEGKSSVWGGVGSYLGGFLKKS